MTPEALAALHARAMTSPAPYPAAAFAALLATPGVFLVGDARGFALGRVAADEAELVTIAVLPEARRQGIGRRLLGAFRDEAERRGAAHAFLEVAEDNAAARALYAAEGWIEAGRRPGYYAAGEGRRRDALILRRPLGTAAASGHSAGSGGKTC